MELIHNLCLLLVWGGVLIRNVVRYKTGVYQENLPGRSDAQNLEKYI